MPETVANCAESMFGVVSVGLATVVASVDAPVMVPEPLIVIGMGVLSAEDGYRNLYRVL